MDKKSADYYKNLVPYSYKKRNEHNIPIELTLFALSPESLENKTFVNSVEITISPNHIQEFSKKDY